MRWIRTSWHSRQRRLLPPASRERTCGILQRDFVHHHSFCNDYVHDRVHKFVNHHSLCSDYVDRVHKSVCGTFSPDHRSERSDLWALSWGCYHCQVCTHFVFPCCIFVAVCMVRIILCIHGCVWIVIKYGHRKRKPRLSITSRLVFFIERRGLHGTIPIISSCARDNNEAYLDSGRIHCTRKLCQGYPKVIYDSKLTKRLEKQNSNRKPRGNCGHSKTYQVSIEVRPKTWKGEKIVEFSVYANND